MANDKFEGFFLGNFFFDPEGTLYAEYCTASGTFTTDVSQAVIFEKRTDAELFAIQNDLECRLHGAFLNE